MDRREFLTGSTLAAAAGIALDACAPEGYGIIPVLVPEEPFVPGEETFLPSTCFECEALCGIRVRKIDGRLVKVEGDPFDPSSRGGLCARGQALPQAMYHPDRIPGPLARDGERGSGRFRSIPWDEALDRVAAEISRAGACGIVTGRIAGQRLRMVDRFLAGIGSGLRYEHDPFPPGTLARAHEIATGQRAAFDFDMSAASYVVSFGAELLESGRSPVRFARALAEMRQGRPGRRGKLVMVGPRLSLTAANADEWIPARPGHELDLALSIAAVLFERGLASGNDVEAFRELCLSRAKPSTVAERTGVPLKRIERVASELADNRPAVALAGGPSLRSERGVALALAVSHLNALLGAYSESGLLRAESSVPVFPADAGNARGLASELASGRPLPPVLFVSDSNPMFSLPPGFELGDRLDRTFLVSFASFPDETMQMADVVLPESMSFERFEEALPDFGLAPLARLSGPLLVRPIHDTRSMPDVLIALAQRLGFSSYPSGTYENILRERWSSLGAWDEFLARGFFAGERQTEKRPVEYRFATEPIERAVAGSQAASEPGLTLHLYPSTAFGDGSGARLPYLQDLADPVTGIRWGSVLEIAESDARRIGIETGDRIELRAGERSVEAPAFVSQGVVPGVVALAVGQGHTANGRHAEGRGVNAYSLLEAAADEDGFLLTAENLEIRKL